MAKLWAEKIMEDNGKGEYTFARVPRLLKDKVRAILIEKGREDLL